MRSVLLLMTALALALTPVVAVGGGSSCDIDAIYGTFGPSTPGKVAAPFITVTAAPKLGTTPSLILTSSTDVPADGFIIIGPFQSKTPAFGGTLLTTPNLIVETGLLPSYANSKLVQIPIANDPNLCGVHATLQLLVLDDAAVQGVAMSPGLNMTIGN